MHAHPDDVPSDNDNDTDFDVRVEYGVRRSLRRTNFSTARKTLFKSWTLRCTWSRRSSSCLWQTIFFRSCRSSSRSTTLHKRSALRAWERTASPVAAVGAQLRDDIIFVGVALSELYFLVGWVGACGASQTPLHTYDNYLSSNTYY